MIKYNLICECGKKFESWFSSSVEYDVLKRKKLINCIYCDSTSIKKSIMSPNLFGKSNKIHKKTASQKKWDYVCRYNKQKLKVIYVCNIGG